MSGWLARIYIMNRNWRALVLAAALVGMLLYFYVFPVPELVKKETIEGTVEKILCDRDRAKSGCMIRFRIPEGGTVSILMTTHFPLPHPGDKVPLTVEHMSDDTRYFIVDILEWEQRQMR